MRSFVKYGIPILLFAGILCLQTSVSAQNTVVLSSDSLNLSDNEGKRHGKWIVFYSRFGASGPVKAEEGSYEHGKRAGIWKAYHPNGKKKSETMYVDGNTIGRISSYYDDGKLREVGQWNLDHWEGKYLYFYPNGQLMYDWTYNENGKKNGPQLAFHEIGGLLSLDNWSEGVRDGLAVHFDEAGAQTQQIRFVKGVVAESDRTLMKLQYNRMDGTQVNDIADGQQMLFDRNGRLLVIGVFKQGTLQEGEQFIYNGEMLCRVAMVKGGKVTGTREPRAADRKSANGGK